MTLICFHINIYIYLARAREGDRQGQGTAHRHRRDFHSAHRFPLSRRLLCALYVYLRIYARAVQFAIPTLASFFFPTSFLLPHGHVHICSLGARFHPQRKYVRVYIRERLSGLEWDGICALPLFFHFLFRATSLAPPPLLPVSSAGCEKKKVSTL